MKRQTKCSQDADDVGEEGWDGYPLEKKKTLSSWATTIHVDEFGSLAWKGVRSAYGESCQ